MQVTIVVSETFVVDGIRNKKQDIPALPIRIGKDYNLKHAWVIRFENVSLFSKIDDYNIDVTYKDKKAVWSISFKIPTHAVDSFVSY